MAWWGMAWRGGEWHGGAWQRKVFTVRNIPYQEYFETWYGMAGECAARHGYEWTGEVRRGMALRGMAMRK